MEDDATLPADVEVLLRAVIAPGVTRDDLDALAAARDGVVAALDRLRGVPPWMAAAPGAAVMAAYGALATAEYVGPAAPGADPWRDWRDAEDVWIGKWFADKLVPALGADPAALFDCLSSRPDDLVAWLRAEPSVVMLSAVMPRRAGMWEHAGRTRRRRVRRHGRIRRRHVRVAGRGAVVVGVTPTIVSPGMV